MGTASMAFQTKKQTKKNNKKDSLVIKSKT